MSGFADLCLAVEINADSTSVVGVQWLDDNRVAHAIDRAHRIVLGGKHALFRHRQTHITQYAVGTFLIAGQRRGNGAGIAGNGRLDAFLIFAVAELHQAVIVQAQPGDVALDRGI